MRPTTSTMLQQNNNNNYPCLNVSGSTREMLQKCSRASLPFPSRLELGLGDLPLIRGLRAWALCSKNRCKAGGLLGGGQAPIAPPTGHKGSTAGPRPADVHLSGEWGRMGYGLPLGVDARQAGIGALVTVATLKTSEGSGKTQTQCLFLRTEKGSCLYSTAKPGPGRTSVSASSGVGGWLRGKTGVGGRDAPAGRRDNGSNVPAQAGANRVRVRSGRRWRKSGNAAGREKTGVSKERQQRSREGAAGERQEERDKGGLHSEQSPSMQQDGRRARQEKEKEGVCRSPRCCHNVSAKSCSQCGSTEQRRESQDEGGEGGEGPRTEDVRGMRKEKQEEEGGPCELHSSNSVLASPNPDLESSCLQPQSLSGCDGGEMREADGSEEPKTQTAPGSHDCSKEEQISNCEILKTRHGNNYILHVQSGHLTDGFKSRHSGGSNDREATENPCEDKVANVNGFPDCAEAERERAESEEEQRIVCLTPAEFSVVSDCYEDVSVSTRPVSIGAAVSPESSTPAEGSVCSADHQACWVEREQEKSRAELPERHHEGDSGIVGKEELDVEPDEKTMKPQLFCKHEDNRSQGEETEDSSSLLHLKDPSILESEAESRCNSRRRESEQRDEPESEEKREEVRERELDGVSSEGDDRHTREETNISVALKDSSKDVEKSCAAEDERRRQDGSRGRRKSDGDTCSVSRPEENRGSSTDLPNVACSDPSTSPAPTLANPDPSLPPLGSMATSRPCQEEEEVLRAPAGDGGQEGKRRCGREQEEERGSTVAAADRRKEEEEDEFGVFMQAEGEPACGGGVPMSASVPCGSRASVAAGESTQWTQGWTDSSFHQSDDAWTAFPSSDEGRDVAGQWWPTSAVDARRDRLSANQNPASVFSEAFPSPPGAPPDDLHTVPTLTQLLRGGASHDQGLLDGFHDLNKMIGQRYKRANGVSRDLLMTTLHLEPPPTERRPAPRPTNRRLSPGLPSANQHAQNAAAKRRLSYDYNRSVTE